MANSCLHRMEDLQERTLPALILVQRAMDVLEGSGIKLAAVSCGRGHA
jgi:hypothetical protein